MLLLIGTPGVSSIVLRNMSSFDLKPDILQFEMFRKYLSNRLNNLQAIVNLCIISLFCRNRVQILLADRDSAIYYDVTFSTLFYSVLVVRIHSV